MNIIAIGAGLSLVVGVGIGIYGYFVVRALSNAYGSVLSIPEKRTVKFTVAKPLHDLLNGREHHGSDAHGRTAAMVTAMMETRP